MLRLALALVWPFVWPLLAVIRLVAAAMRRGG